MSNCIDLFAKMAPTNYLWRTSLICRANMDPDARQTQAQKQRLSSDRERMKCGTPCIVVSSANVRKISLIVILYN